VTAMLTLVMHSLLGNLDALRAVLRSVAPRTVSRIISLGGTVGFVPVGHDFRGEFPNLLPLRGSIEAMMLAGCYDNVGSPLRRLAMDYCHGHMDAILREHMSAWPTEMIIDDVHFCSDLSAEDARPAGMPTVGVLPGYLTYPPSFLAKGGFEADLIPLDTDYRLAEHPGRVFYPGAVTNVMRMGVMHVGLIEQGVISFRSLPYDIRPVMAKVRTIASLPATTLALLESSNSHGA
jgi:hypothetical protein